MVLGLLRYSRSACWQQQAAAAALRCYRAAAYSRWGWALALVKSLAA
jgi:hypothetical protein